MTLSYQVSLAFGGTFLLDLLLEIHRGLDNDPTSLEDRAQATPKFVFSFLTQNLLVHLENFNTWVLIRRLHRMHVLPVGLPRFCVLKLCPILELTFLTLGVRCQILFKLRFVGAPFDLKTCGGLFDVTLDRLGFNLCDRGSLDKKCFFVADGACRPRLAALALVPSTLCVEGS